VRLVDRYGWLAAILLGSVACFRLAPDQSAAMLRVAEFLFIGFSLAGIGEISWHMFTMRSDGSLGLYLGLRYFVIAAIFGSVIAVSSGSEPRRPGSISSRQQKGGDTIVQPRESVEALQPGPISMVPLLVVGGLLAIGCGAFWLALGRGKGKLVAALVSLGGVLSIAKASLTVIDQWHPQVPVTIEPAPSVVSNVELMACRLDTVGPFRSCSADIERPDQIRSISEKYLDGSKTWGSGLIVLVGSADNQRLNHSCMKQFGNNADLARRRADEVLSGLQKWFPGHPGRMNFTIMVSGPRFMETAKEEHGKERSVDAWVVWNWDGRGPKPNCQ
jgi:hypothetical protein